MRKTKTYIENRENEILRFIDANGSITTAQLCDLFNISMSTARAQLSSMSKNGLIARTRGGATRKELAEDAFKDSVIDYKTITTNKNYAEKLAIAKAARTLIKPNDVIGVCGGSTTYLLSKELTDIEKLAVITNSIWIADELTKAPQIDLRVCGGIVNHIKGSLNGPNADNFFTNIVLDKAIIGADTVSLNFGAESEDSIMSHLERQVVSLASEVIILCDHTKFNSFTAMDAVATFEEIDYLVTDSRTDDAIIRHIEDCGVKVVVGQIEEY